MFFNEDQILRYSRNIALKELGLKGQQKLAAASVLVIGTGGLGSPVSLYLAAAGVGRIGLVDYDTVDLSNLQRQIIHSIDTLDMDKTLSAEQALLRLNPECRVESFQRRFELSNAMELVSGFDFIVDGSDNFPTKYLVNDTCVIAGKPFSHAGVLGFGGQVFTRPAGKEYPCLRCILPDIPGRDDTPTCASSGVIGPAAGVIGSFQALETIKYLAGVGELLAGRLLVFDGLKGTFSETRVTRDSNCPVCGNNPSITSLKKENYGN